MRQPSFILLLYKLTSQRKLWMMWRMFSIFRFSHKHGLQRMPSSDYIEQH